MRGTDSSCHTHTRLRAHARVSSGQERAHQEGEAHDNSARTARSCLGGKKMENGRSVKSVPVLVDSAPVQSRTQLKESTTFYWERMKDEE